MRECNQDITEIPLSFNMAKKKKKTMIKERVEFILFTLKHTYTLNNEYWRKKICNKRHELIK